MLTSKTAVGLDRGRRPWRASACKHCRILANINLKNYRELMSCLPFRRFKRCFLSYENGSIDNNEFSAFREDIKPKYPDFSYEDMRGFHSTR